MISLKAAENVDDVLAFDLPQWLLSAGLYRLAMRFANRVGLAERCDKSRSSLIGYGLHSGIPGVSQAHTCALVGDIGGTDCLIESVVILPYLRFQLFSCTSTCFT